MTQEMKNQNEEVIIKKSKEKSKNRIIKILFYIIIFIHTYTLFLLSGNGVNSYITYSSLILVTIALICMLIIFIKYNKKIKEVKQYEYYRDLNFKHVNAVISGILLKKTKVDINTILTAIYELSEKNIIDIQWKENKNYIALKTHNLDEINNLLPYEKEIIYYIFENIDDTQIYFLEEIVKEIKVNSKKAYIIDHIEKNIKNYIEETFYINYSKYLEKQEEAIYMGALLFVSVFILGWLSLLLDLAKGILFENVLYLISYILSVIMFIYIKKGKFIKFTYLEEVRKLKGLYHYMSDYTLLKEQEIKFYQLYNKYYVYAMGLGLADKFEKEFEQEKINNEARRAIQFYFQNKEDIE